MTLTVGQYTVTLDNIFIDQFNTEALFAADKFTPIGQSITASGTATIDITTAYTTLEETLQRGSNRCQAVVINIDGTDLLNVIDNDDDSGGPFCKLTTTQVIGKKTALIQFTVTAQQSYVASQTVVAHRWDQKMSLDAAGRLTRSVSGTLTVARGTSGAATSLATNASWEGKVAYADLFRNAIIPDVPGVGWRREAQEFAMDEGGSMLVYSFTDKRYAFDLPDNVRTGDMSFTYERSLENPVQAVCSFSCELEADLGLNNIAGTTPNRRLVEIAVELSKTRIDLNYARTIVQRMRVTEQNMLSGFSIKFELDAVVMPRTANDSSNITAIGYMVGNAFTISRTESRAVDAYGPYGYISPGGGGGAVQGTYGMIPHWVANAVSGMEETTGSMPTAALFTILDATAHGAVNVAVISGADGVAAMNTLFNGFYQGTQNQPALNDDDYQTLVQHTVSSTKARYDSGIVRLSPMYVSAADFVFQTRKPIATITERVEVSRMNQSPPKVLRELPSNAYLLNDDWQVSWGQYDSQGNRLFSGVYTREYAMYDPGGDALLISGFATQTAPSGAGLRAWGAPNESVLPSYSPTAANEVAGSVFSIGADIPAQYNVPQEDFVT
jgi:hypothetical protein